MGKYIKLFSTHSEYESYVESGLILPNVSYCIDTPDEVHYNPSGCEEMTNWEVIDSSYPSTIEGASSSFDIIIRYRKIDTDTACTETVTEGEDSVTVECGTNPSTADTRAVSGSVIWNDNEITYSLTQEPKDIRLIATFNVTDTSVPTRIASRTSNFSKIEIDGVEQPTVTTGYTFGTTGEHTVKYALNNPTTIGTRAFYTCYRLTSIDMPNSVTSIGSEAFGSCTGLTSITIPDSVTSIDNNAFYGCGSLTSIDIPSGVTSINTNTFASCINLISIDIPSGVTSIGTSAFDYCLSLTSITIPDSVINIDKYAFRDCSGLTNATIGNGVTSIGDYAFQSCTSLTSCTIGSGVTSIGSSAFTSCYNLTSITIPDSVTSIGDSAFRWCSGLTNLTIGSGITSISNYAFAYCRGGITNITSLATTAPTIQSNTFIDVKTGGTLYVPTGSSGYDTWMQNANYYLGLYNWTKVEQ